MKRAIVFFLILSLFANCKQNNNLKDQKMEYSKVVQSEQFNYVLDLSLKTPYELYFDDIKIASNYSRGSNAAIELNPYILKNGKYKVKLVLLPFWQHKEININRSDIQNSRILFGYYLKDKTTKKSIKYMADETLPIQIDNSTSDLPIFVEEWEVEIKDLPYELEGWSKGQDLSKMDQKELEKKVVLYYQKLWNILNTGDSEAYNNAWLTGDKDLVVYDYLSREHFRAALEKNNNEVEKCKNMMIPLEDYEMKLYAQGKIVSLERKTNTLSFNNEDPLDIKGWSPLIRKYKVSGGAGYGVKLYLPQGSNEFVIIRK